MIPSADKCKIPSGDKYKIPSGNNYKVLPVDPGSSYDSVMIDPSMIP